MNLGWSFLLLAGREDDVFAAPPALLLLSSSSVGALQALPGLLVSQFLLGPTDPGFFCHPDQLWYGLTRSHHLRGDGEG